MKGVWLKQIPNIHTSFKLPQIDIYAKSIYVGSWRYQYICPAMSSHILWFACTPYSSGNHVCRLEILNSTTTHWDLWLFDLSFLFSGELRNLGPWSWSIGWSERTISTHVMNGATLQAGFLQTSSATTLDSFHHIYFEGLNDRDASNFALPRSLTLVIWLPSYLDAVCLNR